MAESNVERFIGEAGECMRLAEIATDPLDKMAWVQLAEEWVKLASVAKAWNMGL